MRKKAFPESLPITIFTIHGNHEQRPQTIYGYQEKVWHGGVVYQEEEYPSLLFAKDGEVFDPDGKQVLVIGGAYSIARWTALCMGTGGGRINSRRKRLSGMWRRSHSQGKGRKVSSPPHYRALALTFPQCLWVRHWQSSQMLVCQCFGVRGFASGVMVVCRFVKFFH